MAEPLRLLLFHGGISQFSAYNSQQLQQNIEDLILEKVEAWGMRTELLVKKRFDPPTLPFVWKLRVIFQKNTRLDPRTIKKHPQKNTMKHMWCNSWVTNPFIYQWSKVFCCIMFLCFVFVWGGHQVEVLKLDPLDIHTSDSVFIKVVVSSCAKMMCCAWPAK